MRTRALSAACYAASAVARAASKKKDAIAMKKPSRERGSAHADAHPSSANVQLSKKLAYVLRHGAAKMGLPLRPDAFLPVSSLVGRAGVRAAERKVELRLQLALPSFSRVSFEEIQRVVDLDAKGRYTLRWEPDEPQGAAHAGQWWICANQGHSIAVDALALAEITDHTQIPCAVHGTYLRVWPSIGRRCACA